MKKINLNYQATIFVNTLDINPNPDNLTYFISEFADKELIPGTFQEITTTGVVDRFDLRDSKKIWSVVFKSNRIDIVKFIGVDIAASIGIDIAKSIGVDIVESKSNVEAVNTDMGSLDDFITEVLKYIDIIFSKFPKKANRLALITTSIINELSEDDFSSIFNNLYKSVPTYRDHKKTEWKYRMSSEIPKEFNKREELNNFVTDITGGTLNFQSITNKFDWIQFKLDVNTSKSNTEFRFGLEDIKSYYKEVIKWEQDLREEFETVFENIKHGKE